MAQLPPSSPTIVFDHPIIGFDQHQQFGNASLNKKIRPENTNKKTQKSQQKQENLTTIEPPQKAPHAPDEEVQKLIT